MEKKIVVGAEVTGGGRRQYSREFKESVCQEAKRGEISLTELGRKYEISSSLISKWTRAERTERQDAFRGHGNRGELESENNRLRKENQDLKLEREILKKAAAYFAKHVG